MVNDMTGDTQEREELRRELRSLAERLLEVADEHGCDTVSVRVRRSHRFMNCCAFVGNDIVANVSCWDGDA